MSDHIVSVYEGYLLGTGAKQIRGLLFDDRAYSTDGEVAELLYDFDTVVREYADHKESCDMIRGKCDYCTCGYDDVVARARGEEG